MRRSRSEMHIGHGRLCVCMSFCMSLAAFPYSTNPDVSWGNSRGCCLVVHCSADLQSMRGFCRCDNITPNAKCQRVLVLCLVYSFISLNGSRQHKNIVNAEKRERTHEEYIIYQHAVRDKHTYIDPSQSSIIRYWSVGGDALRLGR